MNAASSPRAGVKLAGTGIAVPPKVLTNRDLARSVDTNDDWIVQRTGIRQRHVVEAPVTCKDIASDALRAALDDASLNASELDLVIVATMTPEMACPSTAARVAAEVGANPAGAVDVSAACSGFVYGMNMAVGLLQTGMYRHVAVVGAEALSTIVDWTDRSTCILFGDGAGAAVLSTCSDAACGSVYQSMGSNGNQWKELYIPRSASDLPEGCPVFSGAMGTLQMNGREVYKFAVSTLQQCIDKAVTAAGIKPADLKVIIPHQSNARILESVRDKLGLPEEKLYINIDRFGNTSAASVPLCLHELRQAGRVEEGDLLLFIALGGGTTWASNLWRV